VSQALRVVSTLLIVICALGSPVPARAQTSATLTGTIVDTSGGVLPDARIAVRQVETGLTRQAVTGVDGRFVFAAMPVGEYDVQVERSGFRPLGTR
jgi:Carboxypeptidase regulatory-like domain